MSSPDTRPLGDNYPAVKVEAKENSSTSSFVDQSTNKHLPYIWFNGVMAAFSFGLGVCAIILVLFLSNRTNVSENHWRTLENQYDNMAKDLKHLQETQHADESKR